MRVKIKDIAKAAGVSPATVSNVFNNNYHRVSEETYLRVLELARKMGYQEPTHMFYRNAIHFVMFRKGSQIVIDSPFFSELISGVESACRKNHYELTISSVSTNDASLIHSLTRETSRAILLLATEMSEEDLRPFLKVKAPMVILDSKFLETSFPSVHIDNIKAGYLAGKYFIRHGHRNLGMITSSFAFNNARDRRIGFETALLEHGLTLDEKNVFFVNPTVESSYEDMIKLLKTRETPLPTGLFAFNDFVGAGAIRAMKICNIRVPEDVSVIGMDNLPTASMITPTLTSISVPKFAMGYQAAEQLIHLTDNKNLSLAKISIDVHLVERDSVISIPHGN